MKHKKVKARDILMAKSHDLDDNTRFAITTM